MVPEQEEAAVLFGDIRDFTSYTASVGDVQAYAVARAFAQLVDTQAANHGGRVVKTYGDGVMAEFRTASDAVDCAVNLHRSISLHNKAQPESDIAAGVGIAWGHPIQEGGDLFGHSVNLAKRLADQARAGQIVVCPEIRQRYHRHGSVRFLPLHELQLKGLPPQPAFEAAWRDELARLGGQDSSLVIILTQDKVVVELSKETQAKLKQAQDLIQKRAEQRGAAGFLLRRLERHLPRWIDRALEQAGIGYEHDLQTVQITMEGNTLLLQPAGRRGLRLDKQDFDHQQVRDFAERFAALKHGTQ